MIVESGNGFQVKSESGSKNLSKPGLSKKAAVKRLREVEYFKHRSAANTVKQYGKSGRDTD
jgi:hypothetical protein